MNNKLLDYTFKISAIGFLVTVAGVLILWVKRRVKSESEFGSVDGDYSFVIISGIVFYIVLRILTRSWNYLRDYEETITDDLLDNFDSEVNQSLNIKFTIASLSLRLILGVILLVLSIFIITQFGLEWSSVFLVWRSFLAILWLIFGLSLINRCIYIWRMKLGIRNQAKHMTHDNTQDTL